MGVPWWVVPQCVGLALAHLYLWWRLVRHTTAPRGWPRRLGTSVVIVLDLFASGALIAMHALNPETSRWVTWPGFIWYGVMVYLLVFLVVAEPIRIVVALRRRTRREVGPSEIERSESWGRRDFLARGIAVTAGLAAVGVAGYGTVEALAVPRINRALIRLPRLPQSATGFRIAVLADVHLGAFFGRARMQRIVDLVNESQPDLIAIPGDLVDGNVDDMRNAVAPLRQLRSRYGTYFCTGNHEYLFDADAWVRHLGEIGVRILRNERITLPQFDIAGVNDLSGEYVDDPPHYERALAGRDARPVVLLAHQPAQAYEAAKYGVDLQLSGHTHGGQFFPNHLITALGQPLLSGHGYVGDTQVYVTGGAGFWGPAVRVGAPSDITVLELAAGG